MAEIYNPQIASKLKRWYYSPLLFVVECLKATPSKQQAEALRNFTKYKFHTIRSGHGTGKDAFASWIILWFLTTRAYPKIGCTGPTQHQLRDVLWAEINKWLRQSPLKDEIVWQAQHIFMKGQKEEWFATALTCNAKASAQEQAETLAGLHAKHMLIVVDEASGVPDPVYLPLEGAITTEDSYALLIGNMTRSSGYFFDTHYRDNKNLWHKIHWSSAESENVSAGWLQYMADKYGEDSNVYKIRVLGEPPVEDSTTLIPLAWAMDCMDNDIPKPLNYPYQLGVDVARFGDDYSVAMPRCGNYIDRYFKKQGLDTIEVAEFVHGVFYDYEATGVAVDEIGVGAGTVDWLRRHLPGNTVFPVNVGRASGNPKKWAKLRDQLWWMVREKCEKRLYRFPPGDLGQELCDELASVKYQYLDSNVVKVESKREMKNRGVHSPDKAEALLMTEYFQVYHDIQHQKSRGGNLLPERVKCEWEMASAFQDQENTDFKKVYTPKSRRHASHIH